MDEQRGKNIVKEVLRIIVPLWFLLAGGGVIAYYLLGSDSKYISKRTRISKNDNVVETSASSDAKKYTKEGVDILSDIYSQENIETLPSSSDGCNGYYYLTKGENGKYKFATDSDGKFVCPKSSTKSEEVRNSCLNEDKSYCVIDGTDYFRFVHVNFSDTETDIYVFVGNINDKSNTNDLSDKFTMENIVNKTPIAQTEEKEEEPIVEKEPVVEEEPIATVIPTEPKTPLVQHTVGVKVSNGTDVTSKLVTDGDNAIFTISPNSGYHYKTTNCTGEYSDLNYDNKSGILHVNSIKGDVSCSVSFVNSSTYSVSVVSSLDSEGVVVDGSADVEHGDSVTFTLKPANNYYPYSNDCGQKMTHNTITVSNVTSDVKCTVNFAEINAVLPVEVYYKTFDVKDGVETHTGTELAGSGEVEYSKAVDYSASVSIVGSPFDSSYTFTGVYCTYATVELNGTTFTVKPYMYGTGVYRCYASFYRYL